MAKLKILKTGETNINTTDIWRYAFNSDYPTFKIANSGSATITIPAEDTNEHYHTISHNLGYNPMFLAFAEYGGKSYQIYGEGDSGIRGILNIYGDVETIISFTWAVDVNTLRIGLWSSPYGPASALDVTVKWLIMLDEF